MKTYKEFTQQIDEKVWDADGRNTTELKKQVRGLGDEHLKDWSKNKKSIFDTKTKKVQDRIISHEIKKRGLNKEEVEMSESELLGENEFTKGTRKIATYHDDHHGHAQVHYGNGEYSVHTFQNGKHQGAKNISYHDNKKDAIEAAKQEVGAH